ncbi:hypothetical protein [Stenomitos frigidus]|uniref:Uncharacterized protein n=1 Tax=Stenomitos frigidus ULC18 TaxID=2107698 RepID=A0A2T1EQD1_9CYAN|nr:hypothetical protein [Stenomitos frigidus]PSB34925.1 hypothetical protein C7B82_01790 [Stenomitos frigidus ULC18]
MDNLQDVLTLAATVVEYFLFAYVAVAFLVYSLKSPSVVKPLRVVSVPQKTWERSLSPTASFASMAS